ncbi:heme o synthase [Pedobacter cryoconitis]|uniref:Protoheme IX farnesyltransferase n=1 Tax=Pedobacter cryoconitis TaxID=188932 RepID=A0A327SLN7_9SPHI|nr:heme o synthase [Pedobacter cryoconitis]MBB5620068.1 protoheme IX farnesyltransferase [Pedobacter cryoconitis]MBB5648219.1 protoheme IX farnesyltransferase [Pedobacter cryoconitis]RAJ29791.1 protoheme IX farnesyltransferase [Pedobacter cryoconitis]
MKLFFSDLSKLIKFRLTFLVVFSASVTFLIGSRMQVARGEVPSIDWGNWLILVAGGFLVTAAANCFNEIIEKDLDKLMTRTMDRPMPAGRMTTGQGLVLGLIMGMLGTWLLGKLNLETGLLSVFSILLYAFVYTPLKRKSPIAVFVGAIPGALPPLIGYLAALGHTTNFTHVDYEVAGILFLIQFVWQFPHFWAIAWVLDDDYKKAGFRLLPTKKRDKTTAFLVFLSTLILIPVSLLPTFFGFGGYYIAGVSIIAGVIFALLAFKLLVKLDIDSARKVMFCSFFYIPLVQLILLFDFIGK